MNNSMQQSLHKASPTPAMQSLSLVSLAQSYEGLNRNPHNPTVPTPKVTHPCSHRLDAYRIAQRVDAAAHWTLHQMRCRQRAPLLLLPPEPPAPVFAQLYRPRRCCTRTQPLAVLPVAEAAFGCCGRRLAARGARVGTCLAAAVVRGGCTGALVPHGLRVC